MPKDILKAQFTKYIEFVIKNTATNYFKKKRSISDKEVELEKNEEVSLSNIDDGTIFLLEKDISYSNLENVFTNQDHYFAMRQLTDRQKLVLYLSIVDSLSAKEIASIIGISEITVRTIKSKAIKLFIKNLKKGN
jgi:RNA polymerase sigma factor (sigma-70 family)